MAPVNQTSERVSLYWQPGCTSCLRTKEFLSSRGVDFESVNVAADAAGWDALAKLGVRTVPVVAQGDRFVFGQVLGEVADFLGLDPVSGPELAPDALVEKLGQVLGTAARLARQVPDARRDEQWPGRARSIRELAHHIFRIPEVFLDTVQSGVVLDDEALNALPPRNLISMADVAAFGETVADKVDRWWRAEPDESGDRTLETYFGPQSLHVVLERTTWHSAQHTRQLAVMLESFDIAPDRPLDNADLAGLPMPESVWDT